MALFDSIINEAAERFDLRDKAGTLLSALLALMTNQKTGGFSGFIKRFEQAGLGDVANSWIISGDNVEISGEQAESAIGEDTIRVISEQTGIDKQKTTSALAFMTPKVVDVLTPEGEIPDDESLLSKIGGFLTGATEVAAGIAVGVAGGSRAVATDVADKTGDALESVAGAFEGDDDGGSILKWLLPLLLLGLLIVLGFMFCGRGNVETTTPVTNANANVNADVNKNVNTQEEVGEPTGNINESGEAKAEENRQLTEITVGDTKLQAYPGGIEDQLVKFIESDEYKNATDEELKNKWFDFDDLNFKFNSTELEETSQRQLDNIAAILKAYPDVKIKIGGYTDKKGNDAANKKLSDDRAKAVKAALEKAGVGSQVPEAEGYGEEFAKVDENASDEGRAADRKTSIRLLKK